MTQTKINENPSYSPKARKQAFFAGVSRTVGQALQQEADKKETVQTAQVLFGVPPRNMKKKIAGVDLSLSNGGVYTRGGRKMPTTLRYRRERSIALATKRRRGPL